MSHFRIWYSCGKVSFSLGYVKHHIWVAIINASSAKDSYRIYRGRQSREKVMRDERQS